MSSIQKPVEDAISKLNVRVNDILIKNTHKGPEVEAVRGGAVVYVHRYWQIVYLLSVLGVGCGIHGIINIHPLTSLVVFLLMWVYADFFSGVVHIVLDNPLNVTLPVIGQACIEFQWHHIIPKDISTKCLNEALGDLNVAALILVAIACSFGPLGDPLFHYLFSLKIIFSYIGQFSHRMAHSSPKQRPDWVNWLQKHHLLISTDEHWKHHTTYSDNFAINSGLTNPFLAMLRQQFTNRWAWLGILMVGYFDVFFFHWVVNKVSMMAS